MEKIKNYFRSFLDSLTKFPVLLRELLIMLKGCAGRVIVFVVCFSLANVIFTSTAARLLLKLALLASGQSCLCPENLTAVLLNPITILLMLVGIFVIIMPPVFEISGLVHAFSMSKTGRKATISSMISAGFRACRRSLHPKNWLIIIYFAVLVSLTGVLTLSSGALSVVVPEFIMDYIMADATLSVIYKIVYVLLLILLVVLIFMINFYILEEKSFFKSCKESAKLTKGMRLTTAVWIAFLMFLFFLFSVALSSVLSELIVRLVAIFQGSGSITNAELSKNTTLIIRGILNGVLAPVINIAAITVLFYERIESSDHLVQVSRYAFKEIKLSKAKKIISVVVMVIFIAASMLMSTMFSAFSVESERPGIVAHRGDSVNAPENTMPAFQIAAILNPDWVEFDVHMTKDGVVIVSHDDDLTRVARQQLYVHELTYEETQQLDVGSWFSPGFSYVRFSTLDEVLKFFKDYDFGIQIEIKPEDYDVNLEEKVVQIIKDNDMQDRCIITCLHLKPLLKIEEIDPDMITVYSMFVAWENIENLPVDYFTVEESNINRDLVYNVHKAGKKIFAWTANTEETIQYLYDCGVDGILTDNPEMLRGALDKADTRGGILRELRLILAKLKSWY